jgi:hypothetical protein
MFGFLYPPIPFTYSKAWCSPASCGLDSINNSATIEINDLLFGRDRPRIKVIAIFIFFFLYSILQKAANMKGGLWLNVMSWQASFQRQAHLLTQLNAKSLRNLKAVFELHLLNNNNHWAYMYSNSTVTSSQQALATILFISRNAWWKT